jgi:hypothetical protein
MARTGEGLWTFQVFRPIPVYTNIWAGTRADQTEPWNFLFFFNTLSFGFFLLKKYSTKFIKNNAPSSSCGRLQEITSVDGTKSI